MATLPEEMIQHIQSFLPAKEAARTSILSKSWYSAWLTRPNLDFDSSSRTVEPPPSESAFVKSVKKSVQRYEDSKLTIQSIGLRMHIPSVDDNSCEVSLVNEMIAKAIELDVPHLAIELIVGWRNFILSDEVFRCKSLVRLSLGGVDINLHERNLRCSNIKSLRLNSTCIGGNNLWDEITFCPSLEELVLHRCKGNVGISAWKSRLRGNEFPKLKVLSLEDVRIDEHFFGHVSGFSCLKELSIHNCYGYGYGYTYGEIEISSNSLECISFTHASVLRANFDVPKIRKFKISSSCVPSLSFKTASKELEIDVSIKGTIHCRSTKNSWFGHLRDFLLKLSSFKTSLHLDMSAYSINFNSLGKCDFAEDIIIPRVEKLTLLVDAPYSLHYTILENLFWSCHPIFMTYSMFYLPGRHC